MNTISKGKLFEFKDDYSIYELYSPKGIRYYLSIPNSDVTNYKMYLGLPTQDIESEATYEIKNEITSVYDMLYKINPTSIYLFCGINYQKLIEASNDNDNLLYNRLLSDIHDITEDVYHIINGNANMDQVIYAIKKTPEDIKFINWLDLKLNGYLESVKLKNIKNRYDEIIYNENIKEEIITEKTEDNVKKKVLTKPNSYGFMNMTFIISILILATTIGIFIALNILNK